jgi:hypothetical protein
MQLRCELPWRFGWLSPSISRRALLLDKDDVFKALNGAV